MTDLEKALRPILASIVRDEVKRALAEHESDALLTTDAAAKLAHVSVATIRHWLRKGKLEGFKAGRRVRIRREDLERALRSTKVAANDATPEQLARKQFGG